jgi:hypothetical protein
VRRCKLPFHDFRISRAGTRGGFRNPKRNRDLFDIYLAVKQCRDRRELTSFLRKLKKEVPDTFNTLHAIEGAITRNPGLLANVNEHLPPPFREPEESIRACLIDFLREAGVDALEGAGYEETTILVCFAAVAQRVAINYVLLG